MIKLTPQLISRYNLEGPRYTSYPTVPNWPHTTSPVQYPQIQEPASLYIHVPFCQKRCFFCACNVIVKKLSPEIGDTYIDYLSKEMALISIKKISLKEIHFGGGTPTYLSDTQLEKLHKEISTYFDLSTLTEMSIEIDPRTILIERLKTLKRLGFNRLSFGVQDLDERVQKTINRQLSFEKILALFLEAKQLGFKSINADLIYGLPNQTPLTFQETLKQITTLNPDRIALYSFAYLPSHHAHQNGFNPKLLPTPKEKMALFLIARNYFLEAGYVSIAMDHFAKKDDDLALAFKNGTMRRNFMGYSPQPNRDYIGIGVSAIGSLSHQFFQNIKTLPDYYAKLDQHQLPIVRHYALTQDDIIRQYTIETLMCQSSLNKKTFLEKFNQHFDAYFKAEQNSLSQYELEKLLNQTQDEIQLTELGQLFVRNICMVFDAHLNKTSHTYSKTI